MAASEGSFVFSKIIEDAIFSLSKEKVVVSVAGRTDAGVNAYGQVAHFDLQKYYDPKKLMCSINHFSRPHTIGVIQSEEVSDIFHARFSAKSRHYVYKILNRPYINIIEKDLKLWVRHNLNIESMQESANFLLGKHDFSSFRASECQANSPIRTIDKIKIIKNGYDIEIQISALSFLHHMVRNIVGSLIMVGSQKWQPIQIKHILEAKDRRFAGATAPAHGLYFLKVEY